MNKKRNTTISVLSDQICNHLFSMVYKNSCPQNGFMECNVFLFSNSFQEKLPIIYANIRV